VPRACGLRKIAQKWPCAWPRAFTTVTNFVCARFADPQQWLPVTVNQPGPAGVYSRSLGVGRICAVQQGNVLAMNEAPFTLGRRLEGAPPIGKELPMELTATVTAIMAIMSFGFLAAVILGMI
jgi:hypothetical protein